MQADKHIQLLLEKYRQGQASPEEIETLENWLDAMAAEGRPFQFADDNEKQAIKHHIESAVFTAPLKRSLPWLRYFSVAAALLLVAAMVYLFAYPGEISVVSAPGSTRQYRLPDGTILWLNNNTELRYNKNFANNRKIELVKGEAFFDVKKDPAHPFIIQTKEILTTVLGTSFSVKLVKATGDIKVSVVTGKVQVSHNGDTLGTLRSLQRLKYNKASGHASLDTVLNGEANGWITDNILMENASLPEVVQWLEDHFRVKVENHRSAYRGEYYLQVKKDISLPEVLQILNLTSGGHQVQFLLKNQTVLVQ